MWSWLRALHIRFQHCLHAGAHLVEPGGGFPWPSCKGQKRGPQWAIRLLETHLEKWLLPIDATVRLDACGHPRTTWQNSMAATREGLADPQFETTLKLLAFFEGHWDAHIPD